MSENENQPVPYSYNRGRRLSRIRPVDFDAIKAGGLSTSSGLEALEDPRFLAEVRDYFAMVRGKTFDSDQDVVNAFYEEMTWANFNSVGMARNFAAVSGGDQRVKDIFNRMTQVYNSVPAFYEEGGRGAAGLGQVALATIADPVNLIGVGAGGAAAKGAIQAGKTGLQATGRAALAGGASEAALSGSLSAGYDVGTQLRDIESGYQESFSPGRTGAAFGLGAGLGGVLGTAGGAIASASVRGSTPSIRRERLMELGFTAEQATDAVENLPEIEVRRILENNINQTQFTQERQAAIVEQLKSLGYPEAEAQALATGPEDQLAQALSASPRTEGDAPRIATEEQVNEQVALAKQQNPDLTDETAREEAIRNLAGQGFSRAVVDGQEQFIGATRPEMTRTLQLTQDEIDGYIGALDEEIALATQAGEPVEDLRLAREQAQLLRGLPARLDGIMKDVQPNLNSNDPARVSLGRKQMQQIDELRDQLRLFRDNGPSNAAAMLAKMRRLEESAAAGKPPAPEAPAATPEQAAAPTPEAAEAPEAPEAEAAAAPEPAPAPEPETLQQAVEAGKVRFTTRGVLDLAVANGLTPADFEGMTPASKSGKFNKSQIDELIKARTAADEVSPEAPPVTDPLDDASRLLDDPEIPEPEAPTGYSFRSEAQEQSIDNLLSKNGLTRDDLDDIIATEGVQLTDAGVITREGAKTIRSAAVRRAKAEAEARGANVRLDQEIEPVLQKVVETIGADKWFTILEQRPDAVRPLLAKFTDRSDEFADYLEAQMGVVLRMDEGAPSGPNYTRAETTRIMALKAAYEASGMEPDDAAIAAAKRVFAERSEPAPARRSDVSSPMSRPPIETTAGRTKSGGIQRYLKRSNYGIIGPAPRIIEGADPTMPQGLQTAKDMAYREIEVDGARVQNKAPIKFISTGGDPIADGAPKSGRFVTDSEGKEVVRATGGRVPRVETSKAGEVLYYDPITHSTYRSERKMRVARMEADEMTPELQQEKLNEALDALVGGGSIDDLVAVLNDIGTIEKLEPQNILAELPPLKVEEGKTKKIALRPKDPERQGAIRVLHDKQLADGKDGRALLGNSDLDDFEIGYVDERASSKSKLARDTFEPLDAGKAPEKRNLITLSEARETKVRVEPTEIEDLAKEFDAFPELRSILENMVLKIKTDGKLTKNYVANQLDNIDVMMPWPRKASSEVDVVNLMTKVLALRKKYVPEEIRRSMDLVEEAKRKLNDAAFDLSSKDKAQMRRLLDAAAQSAGGAPIIRSNNVGMRAFEFGGASDKNNLTFPDMRKDSVFAPHSMPNVAVFAHELGHWLYMNALTIDDRLAFWQATSKYIGKSGVDEQALEARLPYTKADLDDVGYTHNQATSPQEFFANQFMMYVMQDRVDPRFRTAGNFTQNMPRGTNNRIIQEVARGTEANALRDLLQKFARVARAVYDRFFGEQRVEIDEDLRPIFAKILPDNADAANAAVARGPKTRAGQRLYTRLYTLKMHHEDLNDAIQHGSDYAIIQAAGDLARELYAVAGDGPKKEFAAFKLMGDTHRLARTLYREIFDVMNIEETRIQDFDDFALSEANVLPDPSDRDGLAQDLLGVLLKRNPDTGEISLRSEPLMATILNQGRKKFNELEGEEIRLGRDYELKTKRPKKSQGKRYAKVQRAKDDAVRKQKREQSKRVREAIKNGGQVPSAAPSSGMKPLRSMSDEELYAELRSEEAATDRGFLVAQEIERRRNAGGGTESPSFSRVLGAIDNENAHSVGASDIAIPSAPEPIRTALEAISHRDPARRAAAQTIYYRIMNLVDPNPDGANPFPTGRTLRLISGLEDAAVERITDGARIADFQTSEEFKFAREAVRAMATNLAGAKTGKNKPVDLVLNDVIGIVYRLALYDSEKLIDERLFRENMLKHLKSADDSFLESIESPVMANAVLSGADAVGYITNGLIGRQDLKSAAPRLTSYGNMFSPGKTMDPTVRSGPLGKGVYSPQLASEVAEEAWDRASEPYRQAVNRFTGTGIGASDQTSRPPTFFAPFRGEATTVTQTSTDVGMGSVVYERPSHADRTTGLTAKDVRDRLIERGDNEDVANEAADLFAERQDLTEKASNARLRAAELGANRFREMDPIDTRMAESQKALADQMELQIAEIDKELQPILAEAFDTRVGVTPHYIDAQSWMDFRRGTVINVFDPQAQTLVNTLEEMLGQRSNVAGKIFRALNGHDEDGFISGELFLRHVLRGIQLTGIRRNAAINKLRSALEKNGYDSVRFTRDGRDGVILFSPDQARHIDGFDPDDAGTPVVLKMDEGMPSVNSVIMGAASSGQRLDGAKTSLVRLALASYGNSTDTTSAIGKMMQGKMPNEREARGLRKVFGDALKTNSDRLRTEGLGWLADWLSPRRDSGTGHYERIAARTGEMLIPILRGLRQLPDGDTGWKSWARKVRDVEIPMAPSFKMQQPRSHKKIVEALRRDAGSTQERNLTREEREVYNSIRSMFAEMHKRMRDAGVMTGAINPYFPQVWSVEKIKQNQDEFLASMVRYLQRESLDMRGERLSDTDAYGTARRIMGNLIDDDGVYTPPPVSSRSPVGDHVDYQRLIRLDQYQDQLEDVGRFLEDDIQSITSKYVDNATRRIDFAEKFGEANHGLYDYLSVIEDSGDGTNAIADLLSKNRIDRRSLTSKGPNSSMEPSELVLERMTEMPFNEQTRFQAVEAARQAIALAPQGPQAVREFLLSLKAEPNAIYAKRVDAIVGAITDRAAIGNVRPHANAGRFAIETMRSAMRKPIDASGSGFEARNTFSKFMRNFNSVTLLGFTTLTSLGDPALTAIRSGNLAAWSKGIGKWASDPDYREMIRSSGVAIEQLIHERMTGLYGSATSKNTVAFFNATGLSPWTTMQREWAGAVGLEWFKAELTKAARNFNENAPLVQQNGSFKKSYRILRRYGLDGYIQQKKRIDDVSDFNDAPELREAIIKFANETIFTPNPNDIPIWAQTPVGAMIFQLKSFPLMMQRLVIDSFRGAGADPVTEGGRRFAPLLMLATVGPASGMGVNAIKDIVQARGGEGNERQLRDRQFSRIASELGYEPELHGPVDSFLGWYFEGFAMMGGLGLVAELLHDTAVQADQGGAYGAMRTAGVIGGPSVGAAWSAYDVISGTQDFVARGNENGTGRERAAVRALAQRVPVLGGVRDFRENVTTGIAGEPGKPKKPSTSWGEQWDSGWSESGWGD